MHSHAFHVQALSRPVRVNRDGKASPNSCYDCHFMQCVWRAFVCSVSSVTHSGTPVYNDRPLGVRIMKQAPHPSHTSGPQRSSLTKRATFLRAIARTTFGMKFTLSHGFLSDIFIPAQFVSEDMESLHILGTSLCWAYASGILMLGLRL